jgi:hypothetical protein
MRNSPKTNNKKKPIRNLGAKNFNLGKEKYKRELPQQTRIAEERVSGLEDRTFQLTQSDKI